jgi:2-polyprenyl-6-methoxyphenol hydroxylase-like FAD-dependent oxidoreductase
MKIIIVGGGISGLSTYLFLKKELAPKLPDLSITVYESHDPTKKVDPGNLTFGQLSSSTAIVGGGIGLMPNGMHVLASLDPAIHKSAMDGGFGVEVFEFRSARGWKLQSSDKMRGKLSPDGKEELCVSMMRHTLWQSLMDKVDAKDVVYKKVSRVENGDPKTGKKPEIVFEAEGDADEEVVQADLIIGADGVRSKVLKGIFGDDKAAEPTYE